MAENIFIIDDNRYFIELLKSRLQTKDVKAYSFYDCADFVGEISIENTIRYMKMHICADPVIPESSTMPFILLINNQPVSISYVLININLGTRRTDRNGIELIKTLRHQFKQVIPVIGLSFESYDDLVGDRNNSILKYDKNRSFKFIQLPTFQSELNEPFLMMESLDEHALVKLIRYHCSITKTLRVIEHDLNSPKKDDIQHGCDEFKNVLRDSGLSGQFVLELYEIDKLIVSGNYVKDVDTLHGKLREIIDKIESTQSI